MEHFVSIINGLILVDNSLCIYILPVQFLPSLLNPGKHMQRKEPNRFKQAPLTPQGEDVEHSLTS